LPLSLFQVLSMLALFMWTWHHHLCQQSRDEGFTTGDGMICAQIRLARCETMVHCRSIPSFFRFDWDIDRE
jgi:hypothetical protein